MFGLALIGFASGVDAASRFWPGRGAGGCHRDADRQSVYDVCSAHRLCLAGAIATAYQSEVLFHQLNAP
ncbi:hypothetical protein ACQYBH_001499 [Salmonella enterica]|nr:hypothetical protein [Salmonella enterica]